MKWLNDYVAVNQPLATYCDAMTMSGTKVEAVEITGEDISRVVVGCIKTIEQHPDADRLVVTQVCLGESTVQIVTGAKNISQGDIIPVALEGATLANGLVIKKSKLRGIVSEGMMCSVEELGFAKEDFPEAPEDGIYLFDGHELEEKGVQLGDDVKPLFGLGEVIVDYEITSNRPDCLSVLGIAREAAATFNQSLQLPVANYRTVDSQQQVAIRVEENDLCPRYQGRLVKDVVVGPSPKWFRDKLRSCGLRPINNLVDITNFVMLELGQPMHAFDFDCLAGGEIIVRRASEEETIITLDGKERHLTPDMLVIADKERPVAVAGVMGGQLSKVTENTTTVLLESANFRGSSIRKTSKQLGLRSDSSSRYEKNIDSNLVEQAMNRACHLIDQLGAGKVVDTKVDIYPQPTSNRQLTYQPEAINRLLGLDLTEAVMVDIFERLQFEVNREQRTVSLPTFRADIEGQADLAEEVARIYGYDKIPVSLDSGTPTVGHKNKEQQIEDKLRSIMRFAGIDEALTYSFESPKVFDQLCLPMEDDERRAMVITNPLGEDYSIMRTLPFHGLLNSLATNYSYRNQEVRLYEIGKIYQPQKDSDQLPNEPKKLTMALYGKADFFDFKAVMETIATELRVVFDYQPSEFSYYHPYKQAGLYLNSRLIGSMGEIHPTVRQNYGLPVVAYMATLDITSLAKKAKSLEHYQPVPKYPAVTRDLALLVKKDVLAKQIAEVIDSRGKGLLESFSLFDLYEGEQIAAGYKSMAYSLVFRSANHTLKEKEVNKIVNGILRELESRYQIVLRA